MMSVITGVKRDKLSFNLDVGTISSSLVVDLEFLISLVTSFSVSGRNSLKVVN